MTENKSRDAQAIRRARSDRHPHNNNRPDSVKCFQFYMDQMQNQIQPRRRVMEYYLQNTRGGYVGNSLSWWAINDCGYTVDIRCAKRWSGEEYERKKNHLRSCDVFWPCEVIDPLVQHHIDHQDLRKDNNGNYPKASHTIIHYRPDLLDKG